MGPVCPPYWIKKAFSQLIWEMPNNEKKIYLTFDDGPTPEVTPRVLDFLFTFGAKATFFCTGKNAEEHPELTDSIKRNGHVVANHGYLHLNGFTTSNTKYCDNARLGAEITGSNFFRPPYGRITPCQVHALQDYYNIIMWSVMSMDFNPRTSHIQCLQNVKSNCHEGSVIVFHDSSKSKQNIFYVLPDILNWFKIEGYTFGLFE